jgi:hypothetical protein
MRRGPNILLEDALTHDSKGEVSLFDTLPDGVESRVRCPYKEGGTRAAASADVGPEEAPSGRQTNKSPLRTGSSGRGEINRPPAGWMDRVGTASTQPAPSRKLSCAKSSAGAVLTLVSRWFSDGLTPFQRCCVPC